MSKLPRRVAIVDGASGATGSETKVDIADESAIAIVPRGDVCNGKQISFAPAICTTVVLVTTLDQAGSTTGGFKALDVSSLLKVG